MIFDPPHGGYPGEVIAHELYLECRGCGRAYPYETTLEDWCIECGDELAEVRAHPAPESTLPMLELVTDETGRIESIASACIPRTGDHR